MTTIEPGPPSRPSTIPPLPPGSAARRVPFDASAVDAVAGVLGARAAPAPIGRGAGVAWRIVVLVTGAAVVRGESAADPVAVPSGSPGPVTTLTIWPERGRVDVANPMAIVTITGLEVVDLLPGIEAIFRSPVGSVTVARNGRVMARTVDRRPDPGADGLLGR